MLQKLQQYLLLFTTVLCLVANSQVNAQNHLPVTWHFRTEPLGNGQATVVITAVITPGWHIYSQHMEEGGPQPTRLVFNKSDAYTLTGEPEERAETFTFYDSTFSMDVTWLSKTAVFTQKIKRLNPNTSINGKVKFMACTRDRCLLPEEQAFSIAPSPASKP